MPILTVPILAEGPLVECAVGVSESRRAALEAVNQAVPSFMRIRALIDTGASMTAVDPSVIEHLQLVPTGSGQIHTASSGDIPHACYQYDVALAIFMDSPEVHVVSMTIPVMEIPLAQAGFQALIGRDVLSYGIMFYSGDRAQLTLSF
ncbi:MAG TPA: aspartyl protease family protein [Pirellulales bacterium]|nr:aspartyl protease family protein [Pirellulales bacterium]